MDKDIINTEDESNQKNLKTIIEFEKKIQNRVRYLAQEDKRRNGKMKIMEAKIESRNMALQQKEQDNLRMLLLKKKEEALAQKRKE